MRCSWLVNCQLAAGVCYLRNPGHAQSGPCTVRRARTRSATARARMHTTKLCAQQGFEHDKALHITRLCAQQGFERDKSLHTTRLCARQGYEHD
eukprot:350482-Chlamydomonas_euryale.AAC.2